MPITGATATRVLEMSATVISANDTLLSAAAV